MKKISLTILLIILPVFAYAGQFKVIRVYDGDTFKAIGHDIEIKVRLIGIDTPETSKRKRDPGQPYSQQAKKFLTDMILNKIVNLKGYGMGPFNRQICEVFINGRNINLELIKAGLAEGYRGKSPRGFDIEPYLKAEGKARASKIGMWAQDNYISPKEWRKMNKKSKK